MKSDNLNLHTFTELEGGEFGMAKPIVSPQFHLIKEDFVKIAQGALVACIGALLVYLADILPQVDFGSAIWAPAATAIVSILVNVIRKWIEQSKY